MIKSRKKGVIGVDEVGRGPLAGPVTVCAVYIEDAKQVKKDLFNNTVRDSKKISKVLRNNIFLTVSKNRYLNTGIRYSIFSRSAKYIDKYGIQKATRECLDNCLADLNKKGVNIVSLDINMDAGLKASDIKLKQRAFVKGDEKYVEIALASILAKESRDKYMRGLHKKHSNYFWDKNVGYGTKDHRKSIEKFGITKYHRTTYLKGFKLFDKTE